VKSQDSDRTFWLHRPVLVTGVNGFIGSWLADKLVESGARVVGISRSGSSSWDHAGRIDIVQGSVDDSELLPQLIRDYRIDSVFHLAAQPLVSAAEEGPVETFETNIRGTWNLLDACRQNQRTISRVIVASSERTYGPAVEESLNESSPLLGTSPYDVSKICGDLIARSYFTTYKVPVCIARYGNVYGGRDLNFDRIIPGTIQSLLADQQPIIRSDGRAVRDYLSIRDLVEGYLTLAEKMSDTSVGGEVFNFSDERRISVLGLTELIVKLMNRPHLDPVVLGFTRSDRSVRAISSDKARRLLGWTPRISLENGLLETIEWYSRYFSLEAADPPLAGESVLSE